MKFAKGFNQTSVNNYIVRVQNEFKQQAMCICSTSTSICADIYGRPICSTCGKPIETRPRTITIPYWFYEQK